MTEGQTTWRKSSFTGNDNCVEVAWRKSSFTGNGDCVEVGWRKSIHPGHDDCVEVASSDVAVRDTKQRSGPQLNFAPDHWRTFLSDCVS